MSYHMTHILWLISYDSYWKIRSWQCIKLTIPSFRLNFVMGESRNIICLKFFVKNERNLFLNFSGVGWAQAPSQHFSISSIWSSTSLPLSAYAIRKLISFIRSSMYLVSVCIFFQFKKIFVNEILNKFWRLNPYLEILNGLQFVSCPSIHVTKSAKRIIFQAIVSVFDICILRPTRWERLWWQVQIMTNQTDLHNLKSHKINKRNHTDWLVIDGISNE